MIPVVLYEIYNLSLLLHNLILRISTTGALQ